MFLQHRFGVHLDYLGIGVAIEINLVGAFCGTGMHGGKIFLRCKQVPENLPPQVKTQPILEQEKKELEYLVKQYSSTFGYDAQQILKEDFLLLTADSKNPYKQYYTAN